MRTITRATIALLMLASLGTETLAQDSRELALRLVLLPHSGTASEDAEIRRWQTRVATLGATVENLERLGWAYVAKARRSHDEGYYKLAEKTVVAVDARFGEGPEAQLLQGHVLHSLHRFRDAEAVARKLVNRRGVVLDFALLSDVLMEQGKLAEAIDACQRAIDLRPGLETFARAAHLRWLKGDLAGAIEMMESAVRAGSPRDSESLAWVLTRLSGYQLQAGRAEPAQLLAERALESVKDYAPALLARGRALVGQDRSGEAAAALRQAAELNPLPEYQWWLADVLRVVGRDEEARAVEIELKKRGEQSDPRTLALFLVTRGEDTATAERLAHEELTTRGDVLTHDSLAWALAANGKPEQADRAMQAALAEGTQDARLAWHAGEIARANGRSDEATRYFALAQRHAATLTPSERLRLTAALRSPDATE